MITKVKGRPYFFVILNKTAMASTVFSRNLLLLLLLDMIPCAFQQTGRSLIPDPGVSVPLCFIRQQSRMPLLVINKHRYAMYYINFMLVRNCCRWINKVLPPMYKVFL